MIYYAPLALYTSVAVLAAVFIAILWPRDRPTPPEAYFLAAAIVVFWPIVLARDVFNFLRGKS